MQHGADPANCWVPQVAIGVVFVEYERQVGKDAAKAAKEAAFAEKVRTGHPGLNNTGP